MGRRRRGQLGALVNSASKRSRKTFSYNEHGDKKRLYSDLEARRRSSAATKCRTMHELRIALDLDAHVSRSHFPSDEERWKIENLNDIDKLRQMLTLTKVALDRICEIEFPAILKQPKIAFFISLWQRKEMLSVNRL